MEKATYLAIDPQRLDSMRQRGADNGKQALAETLPAGTQRQLPLAKESVLMRASNGSAVEVTMNGARQEPSTSTDPVEFAWRR